MGEVHEVTELITPGPAQALAGLFGVPCPADGEGLPLLWHLVYLLDRPPQEQDLVYREPGANGPARSGPSIAPAGRDWPVTVDPVLLFRFSALTYNAHRIHYDREYARAEGYPGLVVHGPLQALLMAELARPGLPLRCEYAYRLVAPLYDDQGLVVSAAAPDGGAVRVSCRDAADRVTATGQITASTDQLAPIS